MSPDFENLSTSAFKNHELVLELETLASGTGLPDGLFSNPESQFG
jgi:hypothetical protein